jgi:crotonobetainyl-CoA:carnitine CoA-transferase CaiB-like acyl-CoA transferase
MTGALSDVRVLDIATFLAAPFCGTLLAEFGAEVIKIEKPEEGDSLRKFGTITSCGDSLVWLSEARNKKSVTLDLRQPEGAEIFRKLVASSQVVLENFRPGTLEKWGLGFEDLIAINPKLVMLRVSAFGQTGPLRDMPGFARIAHAFGGLAFLAGEPGRVPVVPGSTSLADYMSGLFGAVGVLIALRHAERTGEGQFIDIGLYESIFRVLDEMAPAYAKFGVVRERMGADTVNVVPHSHYETRDGAWVALACSSDKMWRRLTRAMQRPELGTDERFATAPERVKRRAEVNALVALWVAAHDVNDVMAACAAADTPCSPLFSIAQIFEHPQFAARKNILKTEDPRIGELQVPAPVPRLSKTSAAFRSTGPRLGAATEEVLRALLGFDETALARLRAARVI